MQFLGFPQAWRDIFYIIFGVLIVFFTYRLRVLSRPKPPVREMGKDSAFIQSNIESN
jgi:hypothetical protein